MAMEQDIRDAFQGVCDVKLTPEFLQTCEDMMKEFGVDAEGLATQWEIVSVNAAARLSVDVKLRKMRDAFAKQTLTTHTVKRLPGHGRRVNEFTNAPKRKAVTSPEATKKLKPLTLSQLAEKSKSTETTKEKSSEGNGYTERTNMGKVEMSFNESLTVTKQEKEEGQASIRIEEISCVPKYRYMYSTLEQRAEDLEEQLLDMQQRIMNANGWTEEDISPVGATSQSLILVCGRVCCEATSGKLNPASVVLEGSRKFSNGARIKLDLNAGLTEFSLFPGQVIAVRGLCPSGHTMYVKELYDEIKPPRQSSQVVDEEVKEEKRATLPSTLSMFVASGPFSTQQDLEYDPLEDLLGNVVESNPDVLVLMGPFVDAEHPQIQQGTCSKKMDGVEVSLTYKDLFALVMSRICSILETTKTTVVLVPSVQDVTHHASFPQPKFECDVSAYGFGGLEHRMHFASNPSLISVNGILLGITGQDIIMDFAKDDAARIDPAKPKKPRIVRLTEHLIKQSSFYPLFPPSPEAQLELSQRKWLEMPVQPHLVLLSSKLRHFVHETMGTVFVNPGKLMRGKSGGMYARLFVIPNETAQPHAEEDVTKRTKVELVRV